MVNSCNGFVDTAAQFRGCIGSKTKIFNIDVDALRADNADKKMSPGEWASLCTSQPDMVRDLYKVPLSSQFERVQYAVTCASVFDLDPFVVLGVMFEESRFNHTKKNPDSSATGLMQLTTDAVKDAKSFLKKQVDLMDVPSENKAELKGRIDGLSSKDFTESCLLGCAYLKFCESKSKRTTKVDRTQDMLAYYRLGPYAQGTPRTDARAVEYIRRNSIDVSNMKAVYPGIQAIISNPVINPTTLLASLNSHFNKA